MDFNADKLLVLAENVKKNPQTLGEIIMSSPAECLTF